MTIPNRQKPAGAVMPLTVDWSEDLTRYESTEIVSAGWAVESGTVTLAEVDATFTETTSTVDVSGGTAGATQWIVASAETDTGRKMTRRIPLYVTRGSFDVDMRTIYAGVGAAGLDAAGVAALGALFATSPIRSTVLSPSSQKVYHAWPKAWGSGFEIYLGGFAVDMMTVREVTISAVVYYVLETTNLLTGVDRRYETRAVL